MAVSKSTRRSATSTRHRILAMFGDGYGQDDRKREWLHATAHLETQGPVALRFPIYAHLHELNLHTQRAVDALGEIGRAMNCREDSIAYYQSLLQYVRALATGDVLDHMTVIEDIEAWIFDAERRDGDRAMADPDDVYIDVRRREAERAAKGMPPRVRFLEDEVPVVGEKAPEPPMDAKA